jgi:hypothetical protein
MITWKRHTRRFFPQQIIQPSHFGESSQAVVAVCHRLGKQRTHNDVQNIILNANLLHCAYRGTTMSRVELVRTVSSVDAS